MIMPHEKVSHERRKLKKLVNRVDKGIMTKTQVDHCVDSWLVHVGNHHACGRKGSKAHCSTNNPIYKIKQYYNKLWREQ